VVQSWSLSVVVELEQFLSEFVVVQSPSGFVVVVLQM
jgi:hypothetical protein